MTSRFYILNADGDPVPVSSVLDWANWFESTKGTEIRVVAVDAVAPGVSVSTVFLGLDHSWSDTGPPSLFESLVFGGPLDGEMNRYPTRDAAIAGHAALVERARAALPDEPAAP
jgi:hypothetical protein